MTGPVAHSPASVPQIPLRRTAIRTSPSPGTGTGASSTRTSLAPWYIAARIVRAIPTPHSTVFTLTEHVRSN
ncbi:hypothetical protein GCM10022248_89510 [Nonomuraea soli]